MKTALQLIYEFIIPNEQITFIANDDKIAFTCTLLLGHGKTGCRNISTLKDIPTLLLTEEPEKHIERFIGGNFKDFIDKNKPDIIESLNSFAYTSARDRQLYDDSCAEEPEFRAQNEALNRKAFRWVNSAWNYSAILSNKPNGCSSCGKTTKIH